MTAFGRRQPGFRAANLGRSRRTIVMTCAVLTALVAGCSAESDGPRAAADEHSARVDVVADPTTKAPTATPEDQALIDVESLPTGPPAAADHLAEGSLRWHGRTVRTDFPPDAVYLQILGAADGHVVVNGYQGKGAAGGDRFWSIDPTTGHARRLGRTYQSYDYGPRLVAPTGHIWVHYDNRTTPRTMWEIDARTGRQFTAYTHDRVPHGLAAADQALVDAWVARRRVVPDTDAQSRDGSLVTHAKTVNLGGAGSFADTVVVRRSSDASVVARFTFPLGDDGGVERVIFEDRGHLLLLTTVTDSRRHGPQQAIVRCSLADGSCERTTDIAGNMALGVTRPLFVQRAPRSGSA